MLLKRLTSFSNFILIFQSFLRVNKAVKSQKSLQKELEALVQKEKDLQEKIEQDSKLTEKWAAKENLYHQKIEECTDKISNLGALPQVEQQYTKMSLKKVKLMNLYR